MTSITQLFHFRFVFLCQSVFCIFSPRLLCSTNFDFSEWHLLILIVIHHYHRCFSDEDQCCRSSSRTAYPLLFGYTTPSYPCNIPRHLVPFPSFRKMRNSAVMFLISLRFSNCIPLLEAFIPQKEQAIRLTSYTISKHNLY